MIPDFSNLKKAMQTSRLIVIFLIAGVTLFNFAIIYIQSIPFHFDYSFINPLIISVFIISFALYFIAFFTKRILLKRIPQSTNISGRYYSYNKSLITIMAMYEFPALFASVVLLLTANTLLYIIIGLSILFMILNYPMPEKLKEILYLNDGEYEILLNR